MTTNATPILRVEALSVHYGALVALDDVTWEVGAGELLGIIGPNGAGKSSCYDAITAMTTRSGRVLLGGEDITGVPSRSPPVIPIWRVVPCGRITVIEVDSPRVSEKKSQRI